MIVAKEKILEEVPKTTEGLRDALFDEINLIREGKSNPQRARALAQLADRIIDSIRVQIQFGRLLSENNKEGSKHLGSGSSGAKNG